MKFILFTLSACLLLVGTGCKPEACVQAKPLIEQISDALDEGRLDAASSGLGDLSQMLEGEVDFLDGFGRISGSLHDALEQQHQLESLPADEADFAERRLPILISGWQREASAVKTRCRSYLL
jgi:hypothetical protein